MKRRFFALTLALAMIFALALTAHADVIYMPVDTFFDSHMGDCEYVNRSYIANGPGGKVTFYTSPENSTLEGTVPNGEYVYVSYIYTAPDGLRWGCAELWDDWKTTLDGWVPMDYLVKIYNSTDFWNEFGDRITDEGGMLSPSAEPVYFWSYPGSESMEADMALEEEYLPEYWGTFVDDAGRKWGYIGYYMGIRDCWVCLDALTADYDTLYAHHAPQAVTEYEITEPGEEIKPAGIPAGAALLAVGAVALLSGGLLVWLKKKPVGDRPE